jgi:aminopeptidase N
VDEPSERARVELEIDMPEGWIAVGPGARVATRTGSGRSTERWQLDFEHPAYLTSLVAGELVLVEDSWDGVPLLYLAEPHLAEYIEPTFGRTGEILAFLADSVGLAYPYPKYAQAAVDNFPWGGMENISATTLTPLLLADEATHRDQSPEHLVAHEAAHQWFGDLFTCADWSHLWLNEGFATYLTLLWVEHAHGVDEFRAQLREAQEAYLAQDVGHMRRPTVWNRWKEPDDVFDTRAYQGGAARLHLLRSILGDDAFCAGVRAYAAEHVGKSVVTDDLRRAFERASGRDLARFFGEWLYSPGFPEFRLTWSWDESAGEVELVVAQVQTSSDGTPAVFHVPVEIEVRTAEGARTHRVELDERRQRERFPCPTLPQYVRFDVHGVIPKRVQEEKPASEWLALARGCDDVNARREAVLVLGKLARAARGRARRASAKTCSMVVSKAGRRLSGSGAMPAAAMASVTSSRSSSSPQ